MNGVHVRGKEFSKNFHAESITSPSVVTIVSGTVSMQSAKAIPMFAGKHIYVLKIDLTQ